MHDTADQQLQAAIIRQARDLGAACAGIADMGALRLAPSYAALDKSPSWPLMMQSVLVFGVVLAVAAGRLHLSAAVGDQVLRDYLDGAGADADSGGGDRRAGAQRTLERSPQ